MGLAGLIGAVALGGVYFWRVQQPPVPSAARLPASARIQLQPFRQDGLDLTLAANGDLQYRIAMQAGATLVYAWRAGSEAVSYQFADQKPGKAVEAHGAFVAQSSGWYRWRWSNATNHSVSIHLKLRGYYQAAAMPYDR
jgi:hypothetical protein